MIDKELRFMGRLINLILRPSAKSMKRMNSLGKRSIGSNIEGFHCSEEFIPSRDDDRKIRVRIYRPREIEKPLPGFLYLHGGGYAMNFPESDHFMTEEFLKARDCVIISPDYRRSVDEPFPAALHDCYDTMKWMVNNSKNINVDTSKIIVGGASAGGGLTAAVTLLARDLGKINIAFQMPIYPMIDYRNNSESALDNNAPVWSQKHNQVGWDLYIGHLAESDITAYASPALNEDFSNLPPAVTFVGELDPFRDETVEYFKKLEAAGVDVNIRIYDSAYHGFDQVAKNAKVSKLARKYLLEKFSDAIDMYSSPQPE